MTSLRVLNEPGCRPRRFLFYLGALVWVLVTRQAVWASLSNDSSVSGQDTVSPIPSLKVTPPTLSPDSPSNPYTLPEVTVTGVGGEKTVLPTAQPNSSVYGIPVEVMDIPRNVVPISHELAESAGIGQFGFLDPLSMAILSPAALSQLNYGIASSPTIRGRNGLTLINGIEETLNNNSEQNIPWNYNMVESMDLVEGPSNAVYGATQVSGGYVNYITKQPYFDQFRGNLWDTIGMYQQYMWGADMGGPIENGGKLAYRLSYMGQENGGYYQYQRNDQENFYFALGYHPDPSYTIDFYGDYGTYDYTPMWGMINRPTQSLIHDGLYLPGALSPAQATTGLLNNPGAATYLGTPLGMSRRTVLLNPTDGGYGTTGLMQVIQRAAVDQDLQIVNNTFFWYHDDQWILHPIFYSESVRGDYEIDNRTECQLRFHLPADLRDPLREARALLGELRLDGLVDTGIELHYQKNLDYNSDSFIVLNSYSLANQNPMLWNALLSKAFQARVGNPKAPFGGEWPIPGAPPGYYFEPANLAAGSTDCRYVAVCPFYQQWLNISDKLSLQAGARATTYLVTAQTPPGTPAVLFTRLNTTQLTPLVTVGPVYRIFPWMNAYFDFNWGYVVNAADMGGFSPFFTSNQFRLPNVLYEGGLKCNLLHNTLFASLDAFCQETSLNNRAGLATPSTVTGFEASMTYQASRHLWLKLGYAYMHGIEDWTSIGHGPPMYQTYSTDLALQRNLPLNNNGRFPPGIYNFLGFPDQIASGLVTYRSDLGLGVTLGALVMSEQSLGYDYAVKIPTQFILNAAVFYATPRWEARISFYNLTNEPYWLAFGMGANGLRSFNYETIVPGVPFWVQGTVVLTF
ncbi:TonB-dependent receptor [Candidatus Methylacidithermus pantelleriae]|uniref:Outer membrane receptor protein, mostly Fe transport n=1 Tax=Candidatus Methylacidithermus pantelleriae TaxID=2744239 RepID=A0A8J2FMQ3_9BACT|nr:TonB-dependent receptor [Candidatus Methylacidithermus pantelleriae]CAF0689589.1 Outer membrane receptor protein, mostly Fe transport [Candidatus Methylacidithermus pantelleriae]